MYDFTKEYLYHYTSFEAAVKIVASGKLLFSETDKLNDINEASGPEFLCNNDLYDSSLHVQLKRYRQLSFSMDKSQCHKGYNIPAMWGHYATQGHGVCLVFEKEHLLGIIKNNEIISNNISYLQDINPINRLYESRYGSVGDFIKASINEFFFTKTKDWEYENEYRFLTNDPNTQYVEFKDSLSAVILFSKIHKDFIEHPEVKTLSKLLGKENVYRYDGNLMKYTLYNIDNKDITPQKIYDFSRKTSLS